LRHAQSKAWIAALAGAALLLQAALSSLSPPSDAYVSALRSLATPALCVGSGGRNPDGSPVPDQTHQGYCILCVVPAHSATTGTPDLNAPAWLASLAAPLAGVERYDLSPPSELSPIRARAPPRT
jgi:hypothetical protein